MSLVTSLLETVTDSLALVVLIASRSKTLPFSTGLQEYVYKHLHRVVDQCPSVVYYILGILASTLHINFNCLRAWSTALDAGVGACTICEGWLILVDRLADMEK